MIEYSESDQIPTTWRNHYVAIRCWLFTLEESYGSVREWLKRPPWKGGTPARAPRVRIPPLPQSV